MRLSVHHVTRYSYTEPVGLAQSRACLLPRNTPRQMVTGSSLTITPEPTALQFREDFFGNRMTYFTVQESVRAFEVVAEAHVDVFPSEDLDPAATPAFDSIAASLRHSPDPEAFWAGQFLFPSLLIPDEDKIHAYALPSFPAGRPVLEGLLELNARIYREFKFDPAATEVSTPLRTVLELRRGVCQDFAHLMVACARSVRLPARYVSGYILTQPPPGKPRLIGADASHAWASIWCGDQLGWVDLDPTNNRRVDDEYITIGWGRDYQDVSPLRGVILGGGQQTVTVEVTVHPEETTPPASRILEQDLFPHLAAEADRYGPAPVMRALLASQTRMSSPPAANSAPTTDPVVRASCPQETTSVNSDTPVNSVPSPAPGSKALEPPHEVLTVQSDS